MGDKMEYHNRLKELRIENNFTQAEIAYILQTRQEQYSKYENGKRELPIKHLVTLCYLYKVSSDYILGIKAFKKNKICYPSLLFLLIFFLYMIAFATKHR